MEKTIEPDLPLDMVSVGILVVTGLVPLTAAGIVKALSTIGVPSWRPVGDVVASVVERLVEQGLLEFVRTARPAARRDGIYLAPTAPARARLPDLLRTLPLSALSPDIAYKLKVMGLDLLDRPARANQLDELAGHWQGVLDLWQDAERRCPCVLASVRHWMKHNVELARSEIEWLKSVPKGRGASAGLFPARRVPRHRRGARKAGTTR